VQENSHIINKLLREIKDLFNRLEEKSEEIGLLKSENKHLRKQLAEKNTYQEMVARDVGCAAVG
jgi:regulator of replication initiation timing